MAGAVADRELSAAKRIRFAVAVKADDAAVRHLLRSSVMRGAVHLTFEREPDYFEAEGLANCDDQTIAAFQGDDLVCMGRCSRRSCWVDGREVRVGYLAELRLDPAVRGRFSILRDGYRFFHQSQGNDADSYFTSIASDNHRARRLLERGVRGMPHYSFLSELATLLIQAPRRPKRASLPLQHATAELVPEMLRILNGHGRRRQLAAVWSEEMLESVARHGLPTERFLVAMDRGEVVACGAVWDQRAFRQTVIRGYSRGLSSARPLVNFAARFLGVPPLPAPGSALAHAFLSPLAFADGADSLLPDFVEACLAKAAETGSDYLTLALPGDDPRLPILRRRFTTRTWHSRLYLVQWPEHSCFALQKTHLPFLPTWLCYESAYRTRNRRVGSPGGAKRQAAGRHVRSAFAPF